MAGPPMTLYTGQPFMRPVQCNTFSFVDGIPVPAQYNASDALTAAIQQAPAGIAVFAPAIAWYTAEGSQTGYTQGQVQVGGTRAQMLRLWPTSHYWLLVWRALAGDPADPELIARIPLVIGSPGAP